MHSLTKAVAVAAGLAVQVQGKTIPIQAGVAGLTFTPASITADLGDVLEFHFFPRNHSVAQGDWKNACQPATTGGFFSGFVPVSSGESVSAGPPCYCHRSSGPRYVKMIKQLTSVPQSEIFQVTVTTTDPIVFYCTFGSHCQGGMYGVVNPSGDDSLVNYGAAAKVATSNISPPSVFGGSFVTNSSSSATTSAASSTGSATSASTYVATSTSASHSGSASTSASGAHSTTTAVASGTGSTASHTGSSNSSISATKSPTPTTSSPPITTAGAVKVGMSGLLGAVALAAFMI